MDALFLFYLVSLFFLSESHGGNHRRGRHGNSNRKDDVIPVLLEGGLCGFGENYTYFIRPGDPKYVAFYFRGLGFCYDEISCNPYINNNINTVIDIDINEHILENLPQFTSKPFKDIKNFQWTIIMFDQCTEDFHIGNNIIDINLDNNNTLSFNFNGGNNINLIINNILNDIDGSIINEYVSFDVIKHLLIIGSSSGAYGASIWANQLFDYVSDDTLKTIIIDSFWLNTSITDTFIPLLINQYDALNSPALTRSNELLNYAQQGGDLTLPGILLQNLEKFCDLFIGFLYHEYDTVLSAYHYSLTNNPLWFVDSYWKTQFLNDIINTNTLYTSMDNKRVSYYISKGRGHIMFINSTWNDLSTKCDESPTVVNFISDIIGCGKSLVNKYYGKTTYRIRDFPKSWNNINIECLQC